MKVLLLDELEIICDGLELLLRDFFPVERISHAHHGSIALSKVGKDNYDLVIMDLALEGELDGPRTLKLLREGLPQAKIVVFTMLEDEVHQKHAFLAGADGYLGKKMNGEKIITSIDDVLKGHKIFSEEVLYGEWGRTDKKGSPLKLPITKREREVFLYTIQGYSQKEIAEKMNISIRTVENHRQHIGQKLGTNKKRDWMQIAKMYH